MEQRMAQGACVRNPPMTVLGHDMAGDVKKCPEFVSVGGTFPREINSKSLSKAFLSPTDGRQDCMCDPGLWDPSHEPLWASPLLPARSLR